MGNFDKKGIIKKAEKIVEEYSRKDREERKEMLKQKREYNKIKKVNIGLKITTGILAITLALVIL